MRFVKYVRSRGVTRDEAEDVVNQAFLQVFRAQQSFLTAKNRSAFAFKVLGDVVVDHFRALDRRPRTLALIDHSFSSPTGDGGIEALICRLDVEKALDQLPSRQADCLRLELFLDMSTTQIAYYLDISPSAVRSHRSVGRQQLTRHLEAYHPQASPGEEQHG
jgi:RNA polymerase sigma factor (sigma-70 family)